MGLGVCPRIEIDRFIAPANPALPTSMVVVARGIPFESIFFDHLIKMIYACNENDRKSGQKGVPSVGLIFSDSRPHQTKE